MDIKSLFIVVLVLGIVANPCSADQPIDEDRAEGSNAATIFTNRIMPIFRSTDPSSCVQCHLSSVDLKNYILPSHEGTFASLRDQGLIDLDSPEQSKILTLIRMGDKDADKGAKLIHAEMRAAEYEAFSEWIVASCGDERLRNLPALDPVELAKPARSDQVIRHARKSRVIDSFVRNVWSQRMRCFPCHTPHEIGPRQKKALEKFAKFESQYGDQMRIFKSTPEATVEYLVNESRKTTDELLPLLNLKNPVESLIVVKPTSKIPPKIDGRRVPTFTAPVYHMGGLKMHTDDSSYKAFVAWINDYAKVTRGEYHSVKDLPADNWYPTQKILRMRDVPKTWPVGTPVQMFVHLRNGDQANWATNPVAFTQGTITPRGIVNGPLFLLKPSKDSDAKGWGAVKGRLPHGDCVVKVYVDTDQRIADNPTLMLGENEYRGAVEIANSQWRIGFKNATWISAVDLKR